MKKAFIVLLLAFYFQGKAQTKNIADGFYEVSRIIYDTSRVVTLKGKEVISFNTDFLENAPKDCRGLEILTAEYVPLILNERPVLLEGTVKSTLQIALTEESASLLNSFTKTRVMHQVVIVKNGQALTMHKIREAITGRKFEITRCTDKACEKLQVEMQENVKK